jgi:hypothetical protein
MDNALTWLVNKFVIFVDYIPDLSENKYVLKIKNGLIKLRSNCKWLKNIEQ